MSIRTTLTLDEDVYERLQQESRARGLPFKQTLNDVIRVGLHARPAKRVLKIEATDMGTFPGMNYNNVAELLEQAEGSRYK
jgi:hypothetical protein